MKRLVFSKVLLFSLSGTLFGAANSVVVPAADDKEVHQLSVEKTNKPEQAPSVMPAHTEAAGTSPIAPAKPVIPATPEVKPGSVVHSKVAKKVVSPQDLLGPYKGFVSWQEKNVPEKWNTKSLFKHLNIEYLEKIVVNLPTISQVDKNVYENYKKDPKTYDSLSIKYMTPLGAGTLAPMYLKYVNKEVGWGVFAYKEIKVGDFVGEYTGVLDLHKNIPDKDYTWAYPTASLEGERVSLDAKNRGNEMRFVNHSDIPNVEIKYIYGDDKIWHVCYLAKETIPQDAQLLVSYGKKYWQTRAHHMEKLN